jgi:hypothetical protein
MEVATLILLQMAGLYLAIGIGYIATKKLALSSEGISKLLFYVIVPLVFLHGISQMRMEGKMLLLPLIIFSISCTLCLLFYRIGRWCYPEGKEANIIAFASGNGNIGYFGIPLAVLLFDAQTVGVYMVMIIGIILFESTLGYYITTLGNFSAKDALKKIATLPMLHGALAGIALSLLELPTPEFLENFFQHLRGTYTILGMMVVGMGLAGLQTLALDGKFISATFSVKFLAWPLVMFALTMLDAQLIGLFSAEIHQAARLLSIVPLAVNSVIFATLLNAHPEKMASAVFLSTACALIYVPAMVAWFV